MTEIVFRCKYKNSLFSVSNVKPILPGEEIKEMETKDREIPVQREKNPFQFSIGKSAAAAGCTFFLLIFLLCGRGGASIDMMIGFLLAVFGGTITFLILRTGKINHCRLVLFIGIGILFSIVFTLEHQVNRGSILLTEKQLSTTDVPICPITIPFVLPPYYLRGELIFPTTVKAMFGIVFFWLCFALLFGRGWCSWLCFFGGMDQTCAVLAKKPLIKLGGLGKIGRLFPYAFLLFLILVALGALYPLYCAWLCPLRIAYDPPAVNSTREWIMAVIFVSGGLTFLLAGPFLTKKRLYCSMICPLLPVNSIIGKLSPFRVRIDPSRCKQCGICIRECEIFALNPGGLEHGEPAIECSRCGRCMDHCPSGAIDYHLLGTRDSIRPVFITLAVVFNIVLASGFILAFIHYLSTGKIRII